jgi:hypothetical protein
MPQATKINNARAKRLQFLTGAAEWPETSIIIHPLFRSNRNMFQGLACDHALGLAQLDGRQGGF